MTKYELRISNVEVPLLFTSKFEVRYSMLDILS